MEMPWGKRRHEHWGWDSPVGISLTGYRERKRGQWSGSPEKEDGGYHHNSSELVCVRAPHGGSEQRKIKSRAQGSLDSEWQPRVLESRQSGSSLLFQRGSILPGFPWWLRQSRIGLQCKRPRFDPWVRKILWRRNGNPLQHSCLENSMDRGARRATVHGVTKSQTRLSDWARTLYCQAASV